MKPNGLKAWRKKHKYSQAQLADALGVGVMTISRWERGVYDIPPYLSFALEGLLHSKKKGG